MKRILAILICIAIFAAMMAMSAAMLAGCGAGVGAGAGNTTAATETTATTATTTATTAAATTAATTVATTTAATTTTTTAKVTTAAPATTAAATTTTAAAATTTTTAAATTTTTTKTTTPATTTTAALDPDPSGGGSSGADLNGPLTDIVKAIYANLDPTVQLPPVMEMPLTEEGTQFNPNIEYFIGAKGIPFSEAVVSEAAIGAHAYSLVLLRMQPGADVEAAKTKIKNGVDPMKWICVGVDPGDVVVDSIGDLVILIMSEHSTALQKAFQQLAG